MAVERLPNLLLLALMVLCCAVQEYNEHVHVLLTTKSAEAISLLSTSLPPRVRVTAAAAAAASSGSSS
jgi:hypothetical protein